MQEKCGLLDGDVASLLRCEVFDFATGDWTLIWSSVLIRVFRECGVLSEGTSVLASWVLKSSKVEAIVGCRLTRSFGGIEVRCVCCSAKYSQVGNEWIPCF